MIPMWIKYVFLVWGIITGVFAALEVLFFVFYTISLTPESAKKWSMNTQNVGLYSSLWQEYGLRHSY